MVFGALPQEILCACTKESAFAALSGAYTALMHTVNNQENSEIDALAEEFLDLWQDNIRLWAEERDLFTLQKLIEAVRDQLAKAEQEVGADAD